MRIVSLQTVRVQIRQRREHVVDNFEVSHISQACLRTSRSAPVSYTPFFVYQTSTFVRGSRVRARTHSAMRWLIVGRP